MNSPTAEELRSLLEYNAASGEFHWLVDRNSVARAGQRAGYRRADGYWVINIRRRIHLLHRLVWLHVHGRWPAEMIDHINGDHSDNRLSNLREATRSQNMMNASLPPRNTSGVKGVSFDKRTRRWHAYITIDQRRTNLGRFGSVDDAVRVRAAAEIRYFGEFSRGAPHRPGTGGGTDE